MKISPKDAMHYRDAFLTLFLDNDFKPVSVEVYSSSPDQLTVYKKGTNPILIVKASADSFEAAEKRVGESLFLLARVSPFHAKILELFKKSSCYGSLQEFFEGVEKHLTSLQS